MSSDIALAVVGKIVEKTVDPIVNTVVRQFSYIFCYNQNIQTLGEQLAELEASSAGVQLSTSEAERNLEIVDPTVKLWLTKVDDIKSKAIEVNEGISTVGKGCLNGWCPNLKQRYLLSRKATKLTAGIRKLKGKGEKDAKFSHSCPIGILSSEGPSISPKDDGFKSFATRIAVIKDVMDALKDEKINLIGISGMGGVGKTTLMKQVLEKVKEENLFNEIAMTAASQQPDLVKIQGEIAGMLGLKLTDESSNARALRLCERLKRGGSVLVVVDDIWEGIDLGEVGIPTGNGCKVVFTTRMERACTEMAAQSHIKVKVLSDQEGWNLFQDAAGDCVKNEDLVDIAKEVAKECGGLPIALVTLGKALSGRENYEWEDTLRQLKKSLGIDKRVQSCISLSYNFLESRLPDAQPLLLLCSLFEEDKNIPIEQLVKYSMGLDLFDEVETFEETRNRVHTLVNYLKSSNLLLQGDQNSDLYVKLHDTVRDVCLLIASDSPHEYLVKHDLKLKHWPRNNRQKAHTAIALNSGVMEELPSGLEYPNLRLLHLQLKHENIKITEDFFEGMGGLQVFNFDGRKDGSTVFVMPKSNVILPPTLKLLTNLQTLSLEFCKLGGDVSSIGCLKGLKILSFFKSQLDEFPREIGELKNLKLLDLRCEECSLNIEVSLLSRLDQLEILYMGKEVFPSIKELNSLSCLTTLQINVSSGMSLLELEKSVFDKLKRFDVSIGFCFGKDSSGQYGIIRNNVSLSEDDLVWLWHAKLHSLVRRIQTFDIRKCDDEQFAFDETDSAFHKLELLEIKKMSNLREIGFDSKTPYGSFHRLQELRIIELPKLEHLWRGPSQPPSFGNLRVIDIDSCESLESLISPDVARCLVQLEKLSIIDCALDGVISNKGEERDKGFRKIQFPKLKSIKFENLSNFKSFCPELDNEGGCGTIQSLFSQLISFPSLEEIDLRKVPSLERILGHQMQEGSVNNLRSIYLYRSKKLKIFVDSTKLQNLEEVEIRHCESMEVVFDLEGLKVAGEDSPVIFNKLEKIELHIL